MPKSTRKHIKAPPFKNGLALKSLLTCGVSYSYLTTQHNAITLAQVTTGSWRHHILSKRPSTGSLCLIFCGSRCPRLHTLLPIYLDRWRPLE